jgi:Spy/CpxP family protein refolding chaperone
MNSKWMIPLLATALVAGPTTVWLLAQDAPPPATPYLTEQQSKKISPIIRGTQAETARLQTRLGECQRELAALYAHYELDEAAARKLQDEIVELQRQLLTAHHRMQKALRAVVTAEQFERLRRRLEQAAALHSAVGGQPAARPEASPPRQP